MEKYNVSRILKNRNKLLHALSEYVGVKLEGSAFSNFLVELRINLSIKVDGSVYFASAQHLLGRSVTYAEMREFCWRLAGNLGKLQRGIPVLPWFMQQGIEWVPLQILSYRASYTDRGEPAATYESRILAGSACPMKIEHSWNTRYLRKMAKPVFGFTPPWGKVPYLDPQQLVQLRFMAKLEPQFCQDYRPGFKESTPSSGCINWNKRLFKLRNRNITPCPNQFTNQCHECHVGYDNCPAAVRPKTLESRLCIRCGIESWHDPRSLRRCCIKCDLEAQTTNSVEKLIESQVNTGDKNA